MKGKKCIKLVVTQKNKMHVSQDCEYDILKGIFGIRLILLDMHSSDIGIPCNLGSKNSILPPPPKKKKKYIHLHLLFAKNHFNQVSILPKSTDF